jgi:hypothetical protein
MDSRTIVKACLAALVGLLVLYIGTHWQKWGESDEKIVYKLVSCIILAVVGGIFVVMVVLPKIGDMMGTVMYSSGEEVTEDEAMKAAAKMAAGDYEGAIKHFETMIVDKPEDPYPVSEIAKIQSERLGDPAAAVAFLQHHLEKKEWSEDDAAFLMFRIADVHLYTHASEAAKDILGQIAGNFPGTRHSANAKHKINEIEQAQFKELQARRSGGA